MVTTKKSLKSSQDNVIDNLLAQISRAKLNRLVQGEIFSSDYKTFSSFIKQELGINYAPVTAAVQRGLFGYYSDELKEYKNIPSSGALPQYMSSMELIMYREALNKVMEDINNCRHIQLNDVCNWAEESAMYVYRKFEQNYPNLLKFIDRNGVSRNGIIISNFKKALKLNLYDKILTSVTLKPGEVLTRDSIPSLDPYSDEFVERYEDYRENFVNIVKTLNEYGISGEKMKKLFTTYDDIFYNTDYLSSNNICSIDYTLGLGRKSYFSEEELKRFENLLIVMEVITFKAENFYPDIKDPENTCSNSVYEALISTVHRTASRDRKELIELNAKNRFFQRPECSNIFLIASLEKIMQEQDSTFRSTNSYVSRNFIMKAKSVEESINNKKEEKLRELYKSGKAIYEQTSFFDLKLIDDPAEQKKNNAMDF